MKTGALIVASLNLDESDRDNEEIPAFLPMQHLDGTTMIKREIFTLRRAGVTPIFVLCGYQQEVLRNHLSHNGVIFCEDEAYASHSFAETLAVGLRFAYGSCDRVLVVPVEYPAFSADTAERLLAQPESAAPAYEGRLGYPQLYVSKTDGQQDKTGISVRQQRVSVLETDDPGILYSLTADGGPERIRAYVRERRDANVLQMKLRIILQKEEDFFGPGVYELLRAIDETHSIQAAAAQLQMSYSKCWKMVNQAEAQMGFRFVDRTNGGKHGGGSELTKDARVFLDRYQALAEDVGRMSQRFFDEYFRDFQ